MAWGFHEQACHPGRRGCARDDAPGPDRRRVLRLLRERLREADVCGRDAGRADARRNADRAVDAERLRGAARRLRDGRAGAGGAARVRGQDAEQGRVPAHRSARSAAARRVLGAGSVSQATTISSVPQGPDEDVARRGGRRHGGGRDEARDGQDRGAVRRRRVQDPDPVRDGGRRSRDLAQAEQLQDPRGRRAAAPSLRRGGIEVLRREGRSEEGEDRRQPRRAVAAALPLRQRGVLAADPARDGELAGQAGPDRQHHLERQALRGGELQERVHSDELRREERRARAVRRVLRGAVRQDDRGQPRRRDHRVRVESVAQPGQVRSVSAGAAGRRGHAHPRR